MAQYCYYTTADSSSASRIKRMGYNGSTCRKVGYNNTVFVLESWRSCSANFPFTYQYLSKDFVQATADHSFTQISSWRTFYDNSNIRRETSGTSYCWDVNWLSTFDDDGNMHVENAFTFVTDGMTYSNGSYKKTYGSATTVIKTYSSGTKNVKVPSESTYSKTYGGGANQTKIELKFSQSNYPNNGYIVPLSNFYNGFEDRVSGSYTTRYSYNENPTIFVWNTW